MPRELLDSKRSINAYHTGTGSVANLELESSGIGKPADTSLPYFAYGMLKPNEIAHRQIASHVTERREDRVKGRLLVRDGLPLLDTQGGRGVNGWILAFGENREAAYEVIGRFEPKAHYEWNIVRTEADERVNVLAGLRVKLGRPDELDGVWSNASDPVFEHALPLVRRWADELCECEFAPSSKGLATEEWLRFFRIKAAYLLLWSVIERLTMLAYGPTIKPTPRNTRLLGADRAWRTAMNECLAREEPPFVVRSRNPKDKITRAVDNPVKAAEFYYTVRSNMCHRGKGGFRDAELARVALRELVDLTERTLRNMRSRD